MKPVDRSHEPLDQSSPLHLAWILVLVLGVAGGAAAYSSNQAWIEVEAGHPALAKAASELTLEQGKRARSDKLAEQLQYENERLKGLPVKVVYRCEEKRPLPRFSRETQFVGGWK